MSDLMDRLQFAKRKLEKAEKEKIVIETKIGSLLEKLNDEGYDDVGKAKEAVKSMEETIFEMEDTLGRMLNEFESKYDSLMGD